MLWKILAVGYPLIIAAVMIITGVLRYLSRTHGGIQTTGLVIGKATLKKRYTKTKIDVDAPIVKYSVGGKEYTCTVSKFRMAGVNYFEKGEEIRLRVSKKNPYRVEAVDSGGASEKFLIGGGIFMIIAFAAVYIRNWDML